MPTVLKVGSRRLFFFSNEGVEPPHIHVESGDCYAKFWLDPVVLSGSVGYNRTELKVLRELVQEHRSRLLEAWYDYFGQ